MTSRRRSAFPPATRSPSGRIAKGEPVRRYGQIIGFASRPIAPGQHVHVHNCEMGDFAKDYAYGVDAKPTDYVRSRRRRSRASAAPDGRVATRNYIGILTSVNCSRPCRRAGRRHVPAQPVHRRRSAGRLSERRRRRRADPQDRLRHDRGRAAARAAAHAGRLCAAPEFLPCHRAGPRLRGEPDRRPDGGTAAGRTASATWTSRPWAARARRSRPAWRSCSEVLAEANRVTREPCRPAN